MKTFFKIPLLLMIGFSLSFVGCTHDDRQDTTVPVDPDLASYEAADVVSGYKLFNDFRKAGTGSSDDFVPNDATIDPANINDFNEFYRCKSCHGWDLKGRYGSYINRGPQAARPDVAPIQLLNLQYADKRVIFDKIKNVGGPAVDPARTADGLNPALGGNNHADYGGILTDAQIWDLVKFLKEGALDTDQLYQINTTGTYPTGTQTYSDLGRDGNATSGNTFYTNKCASCHGTDGKLIMFGGTTSVGKFARTKPYELQFKVLSGQLGTSMGHTPTSLSEMKNLLKALNDNVTYPN